MRRRWLAAGLAAGLAACDPAPEAEARVLCTTVCRCLASPLPGQQDACVTDCTQSGDLEAASQACAECIFTHADRCASLVTACNPLCGPPEADVRGGD